MDLDYDSNVKLIDDYYKSILKIKDDFFLALKSSNNNFAAAIIQETNNGRNINKQRIVDIYKDAADKQNELEQDRANIINNMNALADYKILLEYSKETEGFDTMSPQIMSRDSVTLYNLQYLQIFCKVLGIVIIIAIFWNYFSSITGMTSLSMPSIIPQSLPQPAAQSVST
jgi:hypothetical protein